jgi:hypothetical protein
MIGDEIEIRRCVSVQILEFPVFSSQLKMSTEESPDLTEEHHETYQPPPQKTIEELVVSFPDFVSVGDFP